LFKSWDNCLAGFLKNKLIFHTWPGLDIILLVYLLYVIFIGLGYYNQQTEAFVIAFLQHSYSPLFAIFLVMIGYQIYGERVGYQIINLLGLVGIIIVSMNILGLVFSQWHQVIYNGYSGQKLYFPLNRSSQLAGFLACVYPLSVHWYTEQKCFRAFTFTSFGIFSVMFLCVMLGSGSRSGFAVLFIEVFLVLFYLIVSRYYRIRKWDLLVTVIILCAGLYMISHFILTNSAAMRSSKVLIDMRGNKNPFVPDERLSIWNNAHKQIVYHPFIGGGLTSTKGSTVQAEHNTYHSILAEAGLGTFVIVISIFFIMPLLCLLRISNTFFKKKNSNIAIILIVLLGQSLFSFYHYTLKQRWVWLIIVLAAQASVCHWYNNRDSSLQLKSGINNLEQGSA